MVVAELDFANPRRPTAEFLQDDAGLSAWHRRHHRPMVQRRQPRRIERAQRGHLRHEGRQQQGLQQPSVVFEAALALRIGTPVLQVLPRDAMLCSSSGSSFWVHSFLALSNWMRIPSEKGWSPGRDLVPQIADWDQVAEPQLVRRFFTSSVSISFSAVRSRWRTDDAAISACTSAGLNG